jgi:uncharacterized metal-binding protein YceD (DUF177 family)
MEIQVQTILQSPHDVTRHAIQEWIELPGDDEKLLTPITGNLVITRASDKLLNVTGEFHAQLRLPCDRCGNPFDFQAHFNLEEVLEVSDTPLTTYEVDTSVYVQGALDASDLVRQGLLLSLPPRLLCGCEPLAGSKSSKATGDPRWGALQSLMSEPNEPPT